MGLFDEFFQDDDGPATMGATAVGEQARGVKYTDGAKYEVRRDPMLSWAKTHINRAGTDWRGPTVDSSVIHSYYKKKWSDPNRAKEKRHLGAALAGLNPTPEESRLWSRQALIWVIAPDGKVYSHIPKVGRFHHSSFLSGKEVKSAGMWVVKNGVIEEMAPLSGHYRPTLAQFMTGVLSLKNSVQLSKPKLYLWFTPLGSMRSVDFNVWSKLSWAELFDTYKSSPFESRVAPIRGAAKAGSDFYPTYPKYPKGNILDSASLFYPAGAY